ETRDRVSVAMPAVTPEPVNDQVAHREMHVERGVRSRVRAAGDAETPCPLVQFISMSPGLNCRRRRQAQAGGIGVITPYNGREVRAGDGVPPTPPTTPNDLYFGGGVP